MSDFKTVQNETFFKGDLAFKDGDLLLDDGLETMVYICLFSYARANEDDELPIGETDRRGWWGEMLNDEPVGSFGSKLWLLEREKVLSQALIKAERYASTSLKILVDKKIASAVEVRAFEAMPRIEGRGSILGLESKIYRPSLPAVSYQYQVLWGNI
jgi:phage gp46-like protein